MLELYKKHDKLLVDIGKLKIELKQSIDKQKETYAALEKVDND